MPYRVKVDLVSGIVPREEARQYIETTERLRLDDEEAAHMIRRDAQSHLGSLYATVTVEEVES
jgi:hypothetical protein